MFGNDLEPLRNWRGELIRVSEAARAPPMTASGRDSARKEKVP